MIYSFDDESTEDIFHGINSKKSRKNLTVDLCSIARRKLDMMHAAVTLDDLRVPPSNHLEALKGDLKGLHSIRINRQYRIVFRWTLRGAEEIRITDYH